MFQFNFRCCNLKYSYERLEEQAVSGGVCECFVKCSLTFYIEFKNNKLFFYEIMVNNLKI